MPRTQTKPKERSRKPRPLWIRIFKWGFSVLFLIFCVGFLPFAYRLQTELAWAEGQVARLDNLTARFSGDPSVILSSDGKELYRLQAEFRQPVELNDVPDRMIKATLAAEDQEFFNHSGVNWISGVRAMVINLRDRKITQGASTITMQIATLLYTGKEKRVDRKIKDIALAMQIERAKTKSQILNLYLNLAYYGSGAHGIAAASKVFLNKDLKQLTIADAALLASCVQRPSRVNPFADLEATLKRRNHVLSQMRAESWISESEYTNAIKEKPKLARESFAYGERILQAPHFVRYVLSRLDRDHPELAEELPKGGYKIYTTIHSEIQKAAELEVTKVVDRYKSAKVTTGAFVLIDSDGKIIAMVGGKDYRTNQFNAITQGRLQPGSSFKPFVYAAAFSTGALGPNDSIDNSQIQLDMGNGQVKMWPKSNKKYPTVVSVRTAFAASLNPAAYHVYEKAGFDTAINYAKNIFGLSADLQPIKSLVLGACEVSPMEMAEAYSVFMLRGDRVEPFGIQRIEGPNREVLFTATPNVMKGVLDPTVSEWMDDLLRSVVTGGTGTLARSVPNARGKTGTTSDNKDAWFCGYTNNFVGIGWIGNQRLEGNRWRSEPMRNVFGGQVTIRIWNGILKKAIAVLGDGDGRKSLPKTEDKIPLEPIPVDPPVDDTTDDPNDMNPPVDDNADPDRVTPPATTGGTAEKPKPPVTETEETQEEVCVDSGQKATIYCPETVTRKFPKGKAPKSKCPLHGPHH